MENVPPCPRNGLGLLPETYPALGLFLGYYNDDLKQVLKQIQTHGDPKQAALIWGADYVNTSNNGVYLQDGMKTTFGSKPIFHHFSSKDATMMKAEIKNVLTRCGFEFRSELPPDPNNKFPQPETSEELGGNLISPVPGICAHIGPGNPVFSRIGCNEKNTVTLSGGWSPVNHIDENIAVIPDYRSKKRPPCNFSLVISSPKRTQELLSAAVKDPTLRDRPFFDLRQYSNEEGAPISLGRFNDWKDAPGLKEVCRHYKKANPIELIQFTTGKLAKVRCEFEVVGAEPSNKHGFKPRLKLTALNEADAKATYLRQYPKHSNILSVIKTNRCEAEPDSEVSTEDYLQVVSKQSSKDCTKLTYQDVHFYYQAREKDWKNKQIALDRFIVDLKNKMKSMTPQNECGDGSDLDVLLIPDALNNSFPNQVNLFNTTQKSVATSDGLSELFNSELRRQFQARGVEVEFLRLYQRQMVLADQADRQGFAHCLSNSIRVCKPLK